MVRSTVTIKEAAAVLGVTGTAAFYLCATGKLRATRRGRNWSVDLASVAELAQRRADAGWKRRGPRPRIENLQTEDVRA